MNRKLVLGVIPAVMLTAIVVPMIIFWGEFPSPMATHWGMDGEPNGQMSPMALLLLIGGIYLAIWYAVWRVTKRIPFDLPSFGAGLAGVGGLLAAVTWITALANKGANDWAEAGSFTGLQIVVAFVAAIAAGFAGWRLAGGSGVVRPVGDLPELELSDDETAVWSGRGRGTVLILIGVVMIGWAVAIWNAVSLALLALAAVVLVFAEVRAAVSARGVAVSLGWLGIPHWTVPMSAIERAEIEEVSPLAYGGWGYRLRPGVRALVVRGGPSLRLVRPDMPDLVLTVTDAETGAGLINTLRRR